MSFSEGLKYAEGVERARDLAWARKCEEEDQAIAEYKESWKRIQGI